MKTNLSLLSFGILLVGIIFTPSDSSAEQQDTAANQKSTSKKTGVLFVTDKPTVEKDGKSYAKTGRITNHTKQPISFTAYTHGHKKGQNLSAIIAWEKWNSKGEWKKDGPLGYCGTGLGPYTLKPNESITVHLFHSQKAGRYRFKLSYWVDKKESRKFAYSNEFKIGKPEKKQQPKEKNESKESLGKK